MTIHLEMFLYSLLKLPKNTVKRPLPPVNPQGQREWERKQKQQNLKTCLIQRRPQSTETQAHGAGNHEACSFAQKNPRKIKNEIYTIL